MRLVRACAPIVLTSALFTGATAHAAPSRQSEIPKPVTAAARAMHCDIVNHLYSSPGETPVFNGETCKTDHFGYFTVRLYTVSYTHLTLPTNREV